MSKVIRSSNSAKNGNASPYSFYDIEAEANALIERARKEGRSIVDKARADAKAIEDTIRREVTEEARKQGFQTGIQEARRTVLEDHMVEIQREVAILGALLSSMTSALEDGMRRLSKAAERDLVALALAIARRIIGREAALSDDVAAKVVRRAVELLGQRDAVELLVNPKDAELVEACLPDIKRAFADLKAVRITTDESVSRGGCIARTESGSVDAKIESQIEQIAKELFEETE